MGTTPRYHFTTMGPGDSFSADGYKFVDADRRLMEVLAYLGAEGHRHTGAPAATDTPLAPSLALAPSTPGTLPGGTRLYYKITLVDPTGVESAGSAESHVDTPAAIVPPGAPSAIVLATGGSLQPGIFYYALSAYYPLASQETTAPNIGSAQIFSGSTNSIRVTFPSLPAGAAGWNIYRRRPGEVDYFWVVSEVAGTLTWTDDGSVPSACDRRRATTNLTNSLNSVQVCLGGATPALPGAGWTWKIYRTLTNASYVGSFRHHAVEETAEGSGVTALCFIDTGGSTMPGQPPASAPAIGSPSKVLLTGGAEVTGYLPWGNVAGIPVEFTFTFPGPLVPQDGKLLWTCEFPVFTILGVRATLGRDSLAAATAVIADIQKWTGNLATPAWSSIFDSDGGRPQVAVGNAFGSRVVPARPGLILGDVIGPVLLQAGGGATPTDADLVITVFGLASGGGGTVIVTADPAADYLALIVADGATAAWPMEENDATAIYADVIGSVDATLNRGITSDFASTAIGPASAFSPHFAGTGGFTSALPDVAAMTAHTTLFDVGSGDFAMEYWARLESLPSGMGMPMSLVTDDFSAYILSGWDNAGSSHPGQVTMQSPSESFYSPPAYDDDVLHHLVFTRRAGAHVIIIDGVEVENTAAADVPFVTDQRIYLGGFVYGLATAGPTAWTMAGRMSWAAWYPVSLSEAQAAAHYAAGLP